jgi:hypothetical protein
MGIGRITSIEKSNDFIGNRIRDLPSCSTMPQSTTLWIQYSLMIQRR